MTRLPIRPALCLLFLATGSIGVSGSATCFATLTSGGGATFFEVCLSDHGNIVSFQTPEGYEQAIGGDGYVLCSAAPEATTHGWDAGSFGENGFGPAVIQQPGGPNTLPLVITRTTTDGVFELRQTFRFDGGEKDLTVTMQVTNLSSEPRLRVRLARFLRMSPNADVETGAGHGQNNGSRTADTALLWDDTNDEDPMGAVFGVALTARSYDEPHFVTIEDHDDWNPADSDGPQTAEGCVPIAVTTPKLLLRDLLGRVTYELGTIDAGRRRRVHFLYRHF